MAEYDYHSFSPLKYIKAIKANEIRPRFRLFILNQDESFKEDISDYIVPASGTLNITYQQGQRRSLNFTLNNSDGQFTPNGLQGKIWINTKFQLELGIALTNGDTVWNSAGVFLIGNPEVLRNLSDRTIQMQCYDKFALLDGTLGGNLDITYQINANENIHSVMTEILMMQNGNGYPLDSKPIVFDSLYKDATTQYILSKAPNDSYGAMLIDLANMISCDIFYGTDGNLVVQSGIKDISQVNKPILWTFDDTEYEYLSNNTSYNFTSVRNKMTVVGANVSGSAMYEGIAINDNPQSSNRIDIIGIKNAYITDSNIYSNSLAQQRAEYELNKVSMVQEAISVTSSYMIHLDVNNCIVLKDSFFNYSTNKFVIQSLSIPISSSSQITITCSNVGSLPYYETT
jgi:hypothetical protein